MEHITKQEMIRTLVVKYGAVQTARYFLQDACSGLSDINNGVAENNIIRTAGSIESLNTNLSYLRILLAEKDNIPSVEGTVKKELGIVK